VFGSSDFDYAAREVSALLHAHNTEQVPALLRFGGDPSTVITDRQNEFSALLCHGSLHAGCLRVPKDVG
jgi:hypothetical protein